MTTSTHRCVRAGPSAGLSAAEFLCRKVSQARREIEDVPRAREDRKLPAALSRPEVLRILGAVGSPKHQALRTCWQTDHPVT